MNFGQTGQSDVPEIDLTPLINIVFLMLVFFMLAGSLKPGSDVEAASMSSDTLIEEDSLLIEINRDGVLLLSGEAVTEEELLKALVPVRMAERKIAVKPDARLAASELLALSDTLRKAGLTSMTLIVNSP